MVEIGGKPILWHIMKIYSAHGINDFVVCLGYRGYVIKEYFANYYLHASDVTFDLGSAADGGPSATAEPWKVTLVDTGERDDDRRAARARAALRRDEDVLLHLWRRRRRPRHLGAGRLPPRRRARWPRSRRSSPPGRFGALEIDAATRVSGFEEKPHGDGSWINGGFFVL